MRVGFVLGYRDLIEGLNRIKNSMNFYIIDRVVLVGVKVVINDNEYFNEIMKKIINIRENLIN